MLHVPYSFKDILVSRRLVKFRRNVIYLQVKSIFYPAASLRNITICPQNRKAWHPEEHSFRIYGSGNLKSALLLVTKPTDFYMRFNIRQISEWQLMSLQQQSVEVQAECSGLWFWLNVDTWRTDRRPRYYDRKVWKLAANKTFRQSLAESVGVGVRRNQPVI
jgi:hypothetical protein